MKAIPFPTEEDRLRRTNLALADENRKLRALMREFCDRVERGEVKSVKTYAKFKEALG